MPHMNVGFFVSRPRLKTLLGPPCFSKLVHSSSRRWSAGRLRIGETGHLKIKIKSKIILNLYKMSKIASKIGVAAIALVTIVGVSGITPASAATADELQAQITALLAQISALQSQLGGSTTGGTTYNFTRDLTLGSTGDDVKALQQFLNSKGFTVAASGAGSVGNESTYFGTLTQSAWLNSRRLTEFPLLPDTSALSRALKSRLLAAAQPVAQLVVAR